MQVQLSLAKPLPFGTVIPAVKMRPLSAFGKTWDREYYVMDVLGVA